MAWMGHACFRLRSGVARQPFARYTHQWGDSRLTVYAPHFLLPKRLVLGSIRSILVVREQVMGPATSRFEQRIRAVTQQFQRKS